MMSSYGEIFENSTRRKKIAGYLRAANDIRQSYQQSYSEKWAARNEAQQRALKANSLDPKYHAAEGQELVLFPSYARRKTKVAYGQNFSHHIVGYDPSINTQNEDKISGLAQHSTRRETYSQEGTTKIEVNVRGWLYSLHKGPLTRKHKFIVGIARQLGGITNTSVSDLDQDARLSRSSPSSTESKINLSRNNSEEDAVHHRTDQVFIPIDQGIQKKSRDLPGQSLYAKEFTSSNPNLASPLFSSSFIAPNQTHKSKPYISPVDLSRAQMAAADSNLMERLGPFMATPHESKILSVVFYNDTISISMKTITNELGQFTIRKALDFVPTHTRVQVSENLYVTEEIKIIEPRGVSLISDIDDTVKHTSIDSSAREVFRNTFTRDFQDLTIKGVKEWYCKMSKIGVNIHYVSNSPWQLFPTLVKFSKSAGLPHGSYHLKSYTGMLQGILEPVSERKKPTISRILSDFPERSFILVGDSGEADLEVYCDIVLANPGRVMMVLIRDIAQYKIDATFKASNNVHIQKTSMSSQNPLTGKSQSSSSSSLKQKASPKDPNMLNRSSQSDNYLGTEDEIVSSIEDQRSNSTRNDNYLRVVPNMIDKTTVPDLPPRRTNKRTPPPRPAKPAVLRADTRTKLNYKADSDSGIASSDILSIEKFPYFSSNDSKENLSAPNQDPKILEMNKIQNTSTGTKGSNLPHLQSKKESSELDQSTLNYFSIEKPGVPQLKLRHKNENSFVEAITTRFSWSTGTESHDGGSQQGLISESKKLELWRRRWKKAEHILESQGVKLISWNVGSDVHGETIRLIEKKLMEIKI